MTTPALRAGVPLRAYTTFGIGGPARLFADVQSSEQLLDTLLWARRQKTPHVVLGRGSNVLVADGGYDGLVIRNARSAHVELLPGNRVRADSGVPIEHLIALTTERGLAGLEHFAGIPSTLGGALWQNLHFLAPDRRRLVFIGDLVEEATVLVDRAIERVDRDWFEFGYDASRLRHGDAIVLDATLRLRPVDPAQLWATVRENLAWRAARHPRLAAERSAGCIFRNPGGAHAARAIEAAGAKGLRLGGATVSRRHANFVLNTGGASAADVCELIDLVAARVHAHSGLRLVPEIAFLGNFQDSGTGTSVSGARFTSRRAAPIALAAWS